MSSQGTGRQRLAVALREHRDRGINSRLSAGMVGVVSKLGSELGGLGVEIHEHGITLDEDNLLIGQSVAQYDVDYGLAVGDSLAIMPTVAGDFIAVAVMTGNEPTDRGASFFAGTTAPAAGKGQNGDFYLNTATSMIYGPKAAGAWPAGVSLVGATGPAGAAGAAGATGATGPAGPGYDMHPFLWGE